MSHLGMGIGDRVKALRKARGISGAELARRVGVRQPSIHQIESGDTKSLRADTLMRLALALQTNPVFLWTGLGSPVAPIDPNVDEAEAADLHRRLSPPHREAWLAVGRTLLENQPSEAPSTADPFSATRPKKTVK